MNALIRYSLIFIFTTFIVGCGFQLRGTNEFSYKSAFVSGQTQITDQLKQSLITNGVAVLADKTNAELQVELLKEESEKRILSLSGGGVVREFELYYRVQYRTKPASETLWSEPQIMESRRDFSYSDANLLAKQAEEKRLNDGMRKEVLSGIMRRLAALKK